MIEYKRMYWNNGQLECEIPFINGKMHGVAKWYYENGQMKQIKYFWHGKKIIKEQWDNIPRLTKLLNGIADDTIQ